jgi:hypothetical protein
MYPCGQPGLPNDSVTAYVNNIQAARTTSGSTTARRAPSTRSCDPTRECFVRVVSASSSSTDPEPAPCHRATDAQCRARARRGQVLARRGAGQPPPRAWGGPQAPQPAACPVAGPAVGPGAGATPRGKRRVAGAPSCCRATLSPHPDAADSRTHTRQRSTRQRRREH